MRAEVMLGDGVTIGVIAVSFLGQSVALGRPGSA
jgi:hypothetical protein